MKKKIKLNFHADLNFDHGDGKMYFFTPIHMIRQNGQRAKRDTKHGFWRATQKSSNILDNRRNIIGTKLSLVYYSKSRNATPQKTSWLMSEYRLSKEVISSARCDDPSIVCTPSSLRYSFKYIFIF